MTPMTGRPVIRLFGQLSIEDGARTPRATRPRRGRDRSRCSRSCWRRVAIACPPTVSPSSSGATSGRRDVAGSLQTFVSSAPTPPQPGPGAGARARRHRAGGVPLRDRARRARPRPLRRAARALGREPTRLGPRLARAGARARPRRGARGRAVRRLGARPARQLSGPGSRRPPRRGRRGARRARLRPRARPHRGGGGARPLQRARTPHRDARSLRARPCARGARPLPHLPHAARRGARARADAPRRAHSKSAVIRQEDVHSLLPRPIGRPRAGRRRPRPSSPRPHGRARDAHTRDRERARRRRRTDPDRGRGRARQDAAARRAGRLSSTDVRVGRASCSELERHLPYVPLATALREALAGVELDD